MNVRLTPRPNNEVKLNLRGFVNLRRHFLRIVVIAITVRLFYRLRGDQITSNVNLLRRLIRYHNKRRILLYSFRSLGTSKRYHPPYLLLRRHLTGTIRHVSVHLKRRRLLALMTKIFQLLNRRLPRHLERTLTRLNNNNLDRNRRRRTIRVRPLLQINSTLRGALRRRQNFAKTNNNNCRRHATANLGTLTLFFYPLSFARPPSPPLLHITDQPTPPTSTVQ